MTYERRLAGVLPHIDIAGTDFPIDWRLRELRETGRPGNHIDINRCDLSPNEKNASTPTQSPNNGD